DDDLARAVAMGVGVFLGGTAVCRPPRVPYAVGAGNRAEPDDVLELRQLAGAAPQIDFPVVHYGHAGRVVAPVLEPSQSLDQHRHDFLGSDVSNNPAHGWSSGSVLSRKGSSP